MNPILLELLPYIKKGYCCSQLLFILYFQYKEHENPELIKAMRGLCQGIASSDGPCGLLTGGACLINTLDNGENSKNILLITNDYANWFYERTTKYSGFLCPQVYSGLCTEKGQCSTEIDQQICSDFFIECWEKILSLCAEYEVEL